jgi:hypothetical protein
VTESRRRPSPSIRKPELVAALRHALLDAGFTHTAVRELLSADETLTTAPHQVPFVARRLGDGRLGTLVRLFVIGAPVSVDHASRALAPLGLQQGVNMGVLGMGRSRVHGTLRILPTDDGLFASDLESADPTDLPADHVMGITESSRMLARLTIRHPIELALDLGSGCGYQAVLAARHAVRVIATDVNPRALAFTGFNALLNGATNVETRAGDRFKAVDDMTFDLIVSNPPFVISPDRAFVFRDSGLEGDRVSEEIVRETPRYLRSGGLASVLVSWIHHPGDENWSAPLRAWVADTECDAWLFRKGSYDPQSYAGIWNLRLAQAHQMQRYVDAVDRWTHYFQQLKIEAIGYGSVLLRRRAGAIVWVREDELPTLALGDDTSAELDWLLGVEDALERLDDSALRQRTITLSAEQRLEQVLRYRDGAFRVVEATLVRERGLWPHAEISAPLAALLGHVSGSRTIGEVIDLTAQDIVLEPHVETFRAQALTAIRGFISHGFLVLNA